MFVAHHVSPEPANGLDQFIAALGTLPEILTLDEAKHLVMGALLSIKDGVFKDDFLNRRWPLFAGDVGAIDHIWLFSTGGCSEKERKGLALERAGYVLTILVLPDDC
jgi:hypothetical protein